MVHSSEMQNDDFEATTHSVGCASALLPQRMRDSATAVSVWYRTNSKSKAAGDSAGAPPFSLDSIFEVCAKSETVASPAWAEMKRRYQFAHGRPAARASSDAPGTIASDLHSLRRASCPLRMDVEKTLLPIM